MNKKVFVLAIALVTGLSLYAIEVSAHMGGMMGGGGDGGWGYGMGPGMTGQGMGHGMGGRGFGTGPGSVYDPPSNPQYLPPYQQPRRPMEERDARAILENHLQSMRNPNLKLGEIEDKGNVFEAEIQTKDGSLVDKILVDKNTGWMRSVY